MPLRNIDAGDPVYQRIDIGGEHLAQGLIGHIARFIDRFVPEDDIGLGSAHERDADDLAHVTLPQDEDRSVSWQQWTQAAGLGSPDWASRGPRLASTLLLQAAAAGDGVALVPAHLAGSHIERGHLINPFAVKFDKGPSYWLVRPQRGLSSPAIRAFCAWLRAEAGTIIRETGAPGPSGENVVGLLRLRFEANFETEGREDQNRTLEPISFATDLSHEVGPTFFPAQYPKARPFRADKIFGNLTDLFVRHRHLQKSRSDDDISETAKRRSIWPYQRLDRHCGRSASLLQRFFIQFSEKTNVITLF
ncbi:MAG: hypothetical protein E6G89_17220 [Alphaproteobacteria bacterium]|nr:MAG: hypothetical protein E6G89_17220 [Alphaproteobacteria bacterium]TMJ38514.1 MAG: hypothetical protein E6G87_06205 [Alphaproteobacteria bacterium]